MQALGLLSNELAKFICLTLIMLFGIEIAQADGACIRSVMSPEEFDKQSWNNSEHVFVGLVTSSELVLIPGARPEVVYQVEVEETFKGNPSLVTKIYTRRIVNNWNAEVKEVGLSADPVAGSGDRLLLFSRPDGTAYVGWCVASTIIESIGLNITKERQVTATLGRLRQWQFDD